MVPSHNISSCPVLWPFSLHLKQSLSTIKRRCRFGFFTYSVLHPPCVFRPALLRWWGVPYSVRNSARLRSPTYRNGDATALPIYNVSASHFNFLTGVNYHFVQVSELTFLARCLARVRPPRALLTLCSHIYLKFQTLVKVDDVAC
jgi:hypothetical protein